MSHTKQLQLRTNLVILGIDLKSNEYVIDMIITADLSLVKCLEHYMKAGPREWWFWQQTTLVPCRPRLTVLPDSSVLCCVMCSCSSTAILQSSQIVLKDFSVRVARLDGLFRSIYLYSKLEVSLLLLGAGS